MLRPWITCFVQSLQGLCLVIENHSDGVERAVDSWENCTTGWLMLNLLSSHWNHLATSWTAFTEKRTTMRSDLRFLGSIEIPGWLLWLPGEFFWMSYCYIEMPTHIGTPTIHPGSIFALMNLYLTNSVLGGGGCSSTWRLQLGYCGSTFGAQQH
jgi:hypothetical protein